ncbi:MAG TPA: hypothetical protein VGR88_05195, partial [Ktedonobacterales bacterium]|nr:hypothetical protein [Ktedonobacterales bacterium]
GRADGQASAPRNGVEKGAQTRVLPRGTTTPLPASTAFPSLTSGPLSRGQPSEYHRSPAGSLSNPRFSDPRHADPRGIYEDHFPHPTQYSDPGGDE